MKVRNWLLSADSVVTRITKWLSFIAAACVGFIMALAVVDVLSSKFFHQPLPGAVQFIAELNVLLIFLAIAYVAQERGHIRITILERFMSAGQIYASKLFGYVMGILVIGFCSWRTVALVQYAIVGRIYKAGTVDFPIWPSNMAVLLGFTFLTITFIFLLGRAIIAGAKS